jgi:hypothetical protein
VEIQEDHDRTNGNNLYPVVWPAYLDGETLWSACFGTLKNFLPSALVIFYEISLSGFK